MQAVEPQQVGAPIEQNERELVQRIIDGDLGAFATLIAAYERLVGHIVFRMVASETDREELCQETFIKVYRNLSGFHFSSKLSTWIGRIAYNACLNYRKKKKLPLIDDLAAGETAMAERVVAGSESPAQQVEAQELQHLIEVEIEKLPPLYKTLITLFHVDGMNIRQISDMTQMPEGTVKNYLFRARKLLKERLQEHYQLEDMLL